VERRSLDLNRAKQLLGRLDGQIYAHQVVHYILLNLKQDDALPLYASANWATLDLDQADCAFIFSKLRMTARQFASTLSEPKTAGIHLKGESHIFSYFDLGEYCLILHRDLTTSMLTTNAVGPNGKPTIVRTTTALLTADNPTSDPLVTGNSSGLAAGSGGTGYPQRATYFCKDGSGDLEKEQLVDQLIKQLLECLHDSGLTNPTAFLPATTPGPTVPD